MTRKATPATCRKAGSGRSGARRSGGTALAPEAIGEPALRRLMRRAGGQGRGGALGWGQQRGRRRCRRSCAPPLRRAGRPALAHLASATLPRIRPGVKRVAQETFAEGRRSLDGFLRRVLCKAVTYTEHGRRFTVTPNDISMALKSLGM